MNTSTQKNNSGEVKPRKKVVILRGVSSAGKSTVAELLAEGRRAVICCADDFFMHNGKYLFDASKLGAAHTACKVKYLEAINNPNVDLVIVANTNTKESEFNYYKQLAELEGYPVFFLVIEKRHEKHNDHNVPQFALDRQEQSILGSLKLQ